MNSIFWFLFLASLSAVLAWLRSPSVVGRIGERKVARRLEQALAGRRFRLFRNVTLPNERGTTQIDLLAISRHGIFVVEVKTLKGRISGGPQRKRWRQQIGRRAFFFRNPLHQNHGHVQAVRAALGIERRLIIPLLVFAGRCKLSANVRGLVLTPDQLAGFIAAHDEPRLSDDDIAALGAQVMAARLPVGRATDRSHRRQIRELVRSRQRPASCTRCGAPMVETQGQGRCTGCRSGPG